MIATAHDLPDVLRLMTLQLREHHVEVDDRALEAALAGVFADPSRGALFIERLAGAAIGVAFASFIWSLEHAGLSLWLDELYVVPEQRERGVGQRMLNEVIAFARARGCAAVDLEVEADHARVESLYRRNGFRGHTRRRWVLSMRGD
jgi:ribosomal protein S18 acetylase RimI-like enzyme